MAADFYKTLGVARDASPDEIKSAYRTAAKKYHPDRNPDNKDSERKFKDVNEAYDVLKDGQKRAAYDRFGSAAFDGSGGFGQAGASPHGHEFAHSMSDIFDRMFGGGGFGAQTQSRQQRGADVRYDLDISLEEAYHGVAKRMRISLPDTCESCRGSGGEDGAAPITCPRCQGAGSVRTQQGFFTLERTCPECRGAGESFEHACAECNGAGRVMAHKTIEVEIPVGIDDGQRIRLSGKGAAGHMEAPAGDLYVYVHVQPHDRFLREGRNLACDTSIPFTLATLGGEAHEETLDGGHVSFKIPEGSQGGRRLRLRGKGMPGLHGAPRGDLYIRLRVDTPVKLSAEQKDLLRRFDETLDKKNMPEDSGFFARVKDFFK